MVESCPRCGAELGLIDNVLPSFCGSCGLPQLRLSSDAAPVQATDGGAVDHPRAAHDSTMDVSRALRVVAPAGIVVVAGASLLPGALVSGAVGGLVLVMSPMLALGVVLLYSRIRPTASLSPVGGARLGALMGFWMGALVAAVTGLAGFVLRYRYHSNAMDARIQQAAAEVPAQLHNAGTQAPELTRLLQSPEFLAGSFILGHALSLLLLVLAGWLCGWMAATVLRVRRERTIR